MTDDELLKLQALCDAWRLEQDACDVDDKRWANHDIVTAYTLAARTALPELIALVRMLRESCNNRHEIITSLRAENESLKAEMARLVLATDRNGDTQIRCAGCGRLMTIWTDCSSCRDKLGAQGMANRGKP